MTAAWRDAIIKAANTTQPEPNMIAFHTSKLMPWHIANAAKIFFAPAMLALNVQAAFWDTWHQVYRPTR